MVNSSSPSCLVLGGGGFIGTNLCRALAARGYSVAGFGHTPRFPDALGSVAWFDGDLGDTAALTRAVRGFDVIVHLIHDTTPESANLHMRHDVEMNLIPSIELMRIASGAGVKRLVFVSSGGTVYGILRHVPAEEDAATEPVTAYGVSKLAIEKYLGLFERLYGLEYRVLRLANPYGPWQVASKGQGLIARLIQSGLSNREISIWGDGSAVRDFIYIDDVTAAIEAAISDAGPMRVFNVGTGGGLRVVDVISEIERQLRRKLKLTFEPGRRFDAPVSILSVERARKHFGWVPKITFPDGIGKTIQWWMSRDALR